MGYQADSLPAHVVKYLKNNDVEPSQLPPDVLETLAGLSLGEVALLQVVGDTLQSVEDKKVVLRVH